MTQGADRKERWLKEEKKIECYLKFECKEEKIGFLNFA